MVLHRLQSASGARGMKTNQAVTANITIKRVQLRDARVTRTRGYTLIELLVVLVIAATMTAVAVPTITGALNTIRLSSAVQTATGAIATTRYQSLRYGYPFRILLDATALTYQVQSEPVGAVSFANVGTAIPVSTSKITINSNTTLQFNPSGTVQFISGGAGFSLDGQTFTIAYAGRTSTVTVSSVGYVTTSTQ